MISSELPEVLRLSHRIVVMCEGRMTGELPGRGSDSGADHAAGNAAAQPDGRCAKCDDGGSDRVTTIVEKETRTSPISSRRRRRSGSQAQPGWATASAVEK